jgi:hypothetical protein
MIKLRDYQINLSDKACEVLESLSIVYLAMEVRTGKTLTSLETAKKYGAKNVLFLTKKKAIKSIEEDYNKFNYKDHFRITVINNESIHKIVDTFDLIIHDESHRFGSFPKPSKGAKLFQQKYSHLPLILLSGTPTPESYSQIYHQFWVSNNNPFRERNFYSWAKSYCFVYQKNLGYGNVNSYEKADEEKIREIINPYMITFTQKDAGFTSTVNENIIYCTMSDRTYQLAERLKRDLVIEGKDEEIYADTAVKLMSKLHQLYSGTIKFESGNTKVIDKTKAEFIYNRFKGVKIGLFYKFKAEYEALKSIYGDLLTNDLQEFNTTDKCIALQVVSGREGLSLKSAKYLVYYNLDYSATSYWQSRDRLSTMDRLTNDIFYVFTKGGLEDKIYKSVLNKKNYTSNHFKKYFNVKISN